MSWQGVNSSYELSLSPADSSHVGPFNPCGIIDFFEEWQQEVEWVCRPIIECAFNNNIIPQNSSAKSL